MTTFAGILFYSTFTFQNESLQIKASSMFKHGFEEFQTDKLLRLFRIFNRSEGKKHSTNFKQIKRFASTCFNHFSKTFTFK